MRVAGEGSDDPQRITRHQQSQPPQAGAGTLRPPAWHHAAGCLRSFVAAAVRLPGPRSARLLASCHASGLRRCSGKREKGSD